MARNEEKQQGRLNRLWLQKEREEGRIKDILQHRPKLSTLNSASAVKKWIPSIKNEIEYYLQQSQLSHYPDRKIAEFQLCIKGLETEYKHFLCKLRALDPSCKHRPWTPRAYTKRRADPRDSASYTKKPRVASRDLSGPLTEAQSERTGGGSSAACERRESPRRAESRHNAAPDLANHSPADQDQPLAFDQTRLAVALAGSRGPAQPGSSRTQSLARVLLSGLPNLHSSPLGQAVAAQARDAASTRGRRKEEDVTHSHAGVERSGTTQETAAHVLGLGCYSSSDQESDA